jgi:hypothetical protein
MLTQSAVLATLGDGATADGLGALLCGSTLFSNGPIGLSDGRLRRSALCDEAGAFALRRLLPEAAMSDAPYGS